MKFKTIIKASYSTIFLSFQKVLHWERIKFTAFKNLLSVSTKILIDKSSSVEFAGKICTERNVELKALNGGKLFIAENVFINSNSIVVALDNIHIGSNTLIGPGVLIFDHDHDFEKDKNSGTKNGRHFVTKPIRIESDVWIGGNSVILKGVTIGKGAVIAAGSIVLKDVEPYCLYAGNPAKKIRTY